MTVINLHWQNCRFHCACVDLDPDVAEDIDIWMCKKCEESGAGKLFHPMYNDFGWHPERTWREKRCGKGEQIPYICSEYLCSACCEYVCMMEMSACVGGFTRGFRTRRVVWRSIIDTLLGIEYKQSFLPLQFWESPKATLCVLITAEC